MKQIILLFLLLPCFENLYAEELSSKENQLAWEFIYERMLPNEYLPKIYKEDVVVNLKGETLVEDSIIIMNIINNLNDSIPNLNIKLSDKKGNFILKLDDVNRKIRVNCVGIVKYPSISSQTPPKTVELTNFNFNSELNNIDFPSNMSLAQKKRYYYYIICRGLTGGKLNRWTNSALNGCVFAEDNFESTNYSKFDFFILKKLYSADFPTQLTNNLPPELKQTAWNSIKDKFLGGKSKELTLYRHEIAVKLKENYTEADSLCMVDLITELKKVLPNKSIFLTSTLSNLDFIFSEQGIVRSEKSNHKYNSITNREIKLTVPQYPNLRKRTLYYNLYRALVSFSRSETGSTIINGCVFDEDWTSRITFHPVDKYILQQLYASDFEKQFKDWFLDQNDGKKMTYYRFKYPKQIEQFSSYLGIVAAFLVFLVFSRKLQTHEYKFKRFFNQGLIVLLAFILYHSISTFFHETLTWKIFTGVILVNVLMQIYLGLAAIVLIYFLEKLIIKHHKEYSYNLLIPFISTTVIPSVVQISVPIIISIKSQNIPVDIKYLSLINSLGLWMIFSSIRVIFIYLRMTSDNIIRKKDLQLARMGELHKQAELQSLQAKINPHFLYNALNSIASLSTANGKKTEKMALALSDFFKYALNKGHKQIVTLKEELEAVETYLTIEKVRFGERLNYQIILQEDLSEALIPQFTIQPIVENAIKHGISQVTKEGLIKIEIKKIKNNLQIQVFDNGPDFPSEPISGYGLQSIQDKLNILYGNSAYIKWQSGEQKHLLINIPLKFEEENE